MTNSVFIDSSGFLALLARNHPEHHTAAAFLRMARKSARLFVTTDYVLSEVATRLLRNRQGRLVRHLLNILDETTVCQIEWMDAERFAKTRELMLMYETHDFSFTDCFSFAIMNELGLQDVLTTDQRFAEMGFNPVL
jgi:uncharacterized protein